MKQLPRGELKGMFLIASGVLEVTRRALVDFALAGIADGGHEGLVYWAGREMGGSTIFTSAVIPQAEHSAQRVFVEKRNVGLAARAARTCHLGLLSQVHSHPGADTRHSDGDDDLVLLPFEGMLSLVAPNYGISLSSIQDFGVHQFQSGRWVLCSSDSIRDRLIELPNTIDLR